MKLILVNGAPGTGKDTFANTIEEFNDIKENRATDPIIDIIELKEPLMNGVAKLFGIYYKDWFERYDSPAKEVPWDRLHGMSQREALIWMSEEVMKPKFGPDVFGRIYASALDVYQHVSSMTVISPDAGFVEELLPAIEKVGRENVVMINTFRKGCTFDNDSRSLVTGTDLDVVGYDLMNNGTLADFQEKSVELYTLINNSWYR